MRGQNARIRGAKLCRFRGLGQSAGKYQQRRTLVERHTRARASQPSPSHVNSRSYLGQPALRKIVVDTGGRSGPEQTLSASRSGCRRRRTPGNRLRRRTATSPQKRRLPRQASAETFFSWPAKLLQNQDLKIEIQVYQRKRPRGTGLEYFCSGRRSRQFFGNTKGRTKPGGWRD